MYQWCVSKIDESSSNVCYEMKPGVAMCAVDMAVNLSPKDVQGVWID